MVAELRTESAALPLLFEPDKPKPHGRATHGWRRLRTPKRVGFITITLERRHDDDEFGAQIQHAIVRYVLGGERRSALARQLGMGETQFQYCLRGAAWGPYSKPVLRALKRLGITTGRGDWQVGARRSREIVAASRTVMLRAIDALEGAPPSPVEVERLLDDLHLLTAVSDGPQ